MLKQSHEIMEKASALASAVKDERWVDAERVLQELEGELDVLGNAIHDRARSELGAPTPDTRDRG
jgi:F0F1-type ATP synthase membrane subunit b/b'